MRVVAESAHLELALAARLHARLARRVAAVLAGEIVVRAESTDLARLAAVEAERAADLLAGVAIAKVVPAGEVLAFRAALHAIGAHRLLAHPAARQLRIPRLLSAALAVVEHVVEVDARRGAKRSRGPAGGRSVEDDHAFRGGRR